MDSRKANDHGETFGAWLKVRAGDATAIGALAKAAEADRQFPVSGTPEDLRKRLRDTMADGDLFETVDEAELDWLAY